MKSWTLKFLGGAFALFLAVHDCGPDGCRPAPGWVCVIRGGKDCETTVVYEDKCPLGNPACDNLGGGGTESPPM